MSNFLDTTKRHPNNTPVLEGIVENIVTHSNVVGELEVMQTFSGKGTHYDREKSLVAIASRNPDDNITAGSSESETVPVPARFIAKDIESNANSGNLGKEQTFQYGKATKSIGYELERLSILGSYAATATVSPAIAGLSVTDVGARVDSERYGPGAIKWDDTAKTLEFRAPGDLKYGAPVVIGANGVFRVYSDNPGASIEITIVFATIDAIGADAESAMRTASATDEMDGLVRLCAPSQLTTSAGLMDFGMLDSLITSTRKSWGPGQARLLMSEASANYFRELGRTTFNKQIEEVAGSGLSDSFYRGIKIVESEHVADADLMAYSTSGQEGFGLVLQDAGDQPQGSVAVPGLFKSTIGFTKGGKHVWTERLGVVGNFCALSDYSISRVTGCTYV